MSTCSSAVRASAGPSARTDRPPKIADLPCTATGLRLRQQAARRRRVSSSTASRRHGATAEPFSSGGRPGDARPRSARALLPPARAARRNQLPGSHPDDGDRRAPATCTAVGTSRRHANRARVRPRWPRSTYSTSPGHSAFIRPELGGEAPRLLVPDTSEDDDEADDDGRTVGAARSPDLYERDWSGSLRRNRRQRPDLRVHWWVSSRGASSSGPGRAWSGCPRGAGRRSPPSCPSPDLRAVPGPGGARPPEACIPRLLPRSRALRLN